MIKYLENSDNTECSSIIMPNQAMPWQGLSRVRLLISLITLTITIPFYSVGLTLALPCYDIKSRKIIGAPVTYLFTLMAANRGWEVSK